MLSLTAQIHNQIKSELKHLPGRHSQDDHAGDSSRPGSLVNLSSVIRKLVEDDKVRTYTDPHQPSSTVAVEEARAAKAGKKLTDFARYRLDLEKRALLDGETIDWDATEEKLTNLVKDELALPDATDVTFGKYSERHATHVLNTVPLFVHSLRRKSEANAEYRSEYLQSKRESSTLTPAQEGLDITATYGKISESLGILKPTLETLAKRFKDKTSTDGVSENIPSGISNEFLHYLGSRIPTLKLRIDAVSRRRKESKRYPVLPTIAVESVKTLSEFKEAVHEWKPKFLEAVNDSSMDPVLAQRFMHQFELSAYSKFKESTSK